MVGSGGAKLPEEGKRVLQRQENEFLLSMSAVSEMSSQRASGWREGSGSPGNHGSDHCLKETREEAHL